MLGEDTIFVSIASYRDPECQFTIKNLFDFADNPERVFIGVCWQYDTINHTDDESCFKIENQRKDQIRIIEINYNDAKGPCLARNLAQGLWRGEKYYLQIDSHMRFIKGWDSILIQMLKECPGDKPIITCYPMGYTLPNNIPVHSTPTVLAADRFGQDGMIRMSGKLLAKAQPKPFESLFWVAGFCFSDSSVIQQVPYDAHLDHLFFGEEMIMSARLWTSGYNFYSPSRAVVFHLWKRDYRPTFRQDTTNQEQRIISEQSSRKRIKFILLNQININQDKESLNNLIIQQQQEKEKEQEKEEGQDIYKEIVKYSLGDSRSLKEYQDYCGVDFINQTISSKSKSGGFSQSEFMNPILELAIKSQQGVPI